MTTFFHRKAQPKAPSTKHANFMAGESYFASNPISTLRMAAASCFFGEPQFYRDVKEGSKPARGVSLLPGHSLTSDDYKRLGEHLGGMSPSTWRGQSPAQIIESAIDAALDYDPKATLVLAGYLRNVDNIRTTPQVILVRAAHHPKVRGTGLLRAFASDIIKRGDEPAVGLAYHLFRYGADAAIPNALKRSWKDALERFPEHQLAKYRMESRDVKTVDVVNLVHPNTAAIGKLVKGELKTTDATWESIISAEGSNEASWRKALDVMGHMGLLRNLRNLLQKGVDPALFVEKLVEGAATGRQLPFRYFSAYKAVEGQAPGVVLDAIEECLVRSMGNLPQFKGRVASLCDNSGSAQSATTSSLGDMHINEIANLTGVITGMVSDDGYVGVFGDGLEMMPVRKGASVFDQFKKANEIGARIGQRTENGIWMFWRKAIEERQHWDNVFVYSDMQAGHGGLYGIDPSQYRSYLFRPGSPHIDVAKLIQEYRRVVNPNVNVFLVQVAGYTDTIVPDFYKRTYILGGWGDGLLRFAAAMALTDPKGAAQNVEA